MRSTLTAAALGALMLASIAADVSQAAPADSAQSRSCTRRADQQGLSGEARTAFKSKCLRGSLAPNRRTRPEPTSAASRAITQPSGADRTVRSTQCNDEAAKRGLHDSALQAFRKSCLASAAPVGAVGSSTRPTEPTPAKPKLDALTDAPTH